MPRRTPRTWTRFVIWGSGALLVGALVCGIWLTLFQRHGKGAVERISGPASPVQGESPASKPTTNVALHSPTFPVAVGPSPGTNAHPIGTISPTNEVVLSTNLNPIPKILVPKERDLEAAAPTNSAPIDLNSGKSQLDNYVSPLPASWFTNVPPVTNTLLAQIALAGYGISVGSIDGLGGNQTAAALQAFQMDHGLEPTGRLDEPTQHTLQLNRPPFTSLKVTSEDLARLKPLPQTWLEKAAASRLDFSTWLEFAGETAHVQPAALTRWNPGFDWAAVRSGQTVSVPSAEYPPVRRAALVRISLTNHWLRAFNDRGGLLAHFPCSIGRIAEKRPVGELRVTNVAKDPNYTFNPEVFPESQEAREVGRKLVLPPGPNNPVGIAWIGLDRPGYGIHGTPLPEQVGRTESHGCFRLANWNADYLRRMVRVGTPVFIEP